MKYAFECACDFGRFEVVKWLYSIKPTIDISSNNEYAFRNACKKGFLELAKWLLSIKPTINISVKFEYVFEDVCVNGHLEVAQWLLTIYVNSTINSFKYIEYAFMGACYGNKTNVAQWLQSLYPNKFEVVIVNENIVNFKIKNEIVFAHDTIALTIENKADNVCPICYDAQVEVQTNCGHNFCIKCITDYYNNYNSNDNCKCPYCRQILTSFNKLVITYK
jgi:hypothetical protein